MKSKISEVEVMEIYEASLQGDGLLTQAKCPSPQDLIKGLRKKINFFSRRKLADHVSTCPRCAEEVSFVSKILQGEQKFVRAYEDLRMLESAGSDRRLKSRFLLPGLNLKYGIIVLLLVIAIPATFILVKNNLLYRDVERGLAPRIHNIQPLNSQDMAAPLVFKWKDKLTVDYYILEIYDDVLLVIWTSEPISTKQFSVPREVKSLLVPQRKYSYMVTAFLDDGSKVESALVGFSLKK